MYINIGTKSKYIWIRIKITGYSNKYEDDLDCKFVGFVEYLIVKFLEILVLNLIKLFSDIFRHIFMN